MNCYLLIPPRSSASSAVNKFHTPGRVNTRHKTGINVLFANGSAHWVDRGVFEDELEQCPAIAPAANPFQDQIWALLDRE